MYAIRAKGFFSFQDCSRVFLKILGLIWLRIDELASRKEFVSVAKYTLGYVVFLSSAIHIVLGHHPELPNRWLYCRTGQVITLSWLTLKWAAFITMAAPLGSLIVPYLPKSVVSSVKSFLAWKKEQRLKRLYPDGYVIMNREKYIAALVKALAFSPEEQARAEAEKKERAEERRIKKSSLVDQPPPKSRNKTQEEAIKEALDRIGYGGIGK